ncbi:uncharacterized protein LOC130202180 isoform X2 [Pseudoliparis swirei]|uniref:uncharacterized protein LOC130202180 isoform X2 n=1 Tax=Pseudoliparis swirei TaxID=2059687 RepID=UPI0024BD93D4|nr:uncharacterized protein LOC130202180 isoform X2 [Pseudoliparis swirei]
MAELRWIKASWFLVLVLQFTAAATGQRYPSFTVRDGDEVSLPCFNVMDYHKNCDSSDWLFDDLKSTVAVFLVKEGQIDAEAKDKSDRLSVSENCSLVIKKVTDEDAGRYVCRQYRSGHQQGQDALVILSVVTMTEHKDSEEVICSVSTYEKPCRHKVKWLIEEEEAEEDHQDMMTSQSSCSASLKVKSGSFNTLRFNSWVCEVTVGDQVQKFTFRNPPSGDKRVWWYVIGAVGLVILLIIITIVAVIKWKRTNGNTKQADANAAGPEEDVSYSSVSFAKKTNSGAQADPEEGVSYASVSYTKNTDGRAQGRSKRGGDDDAVTYASVKVSSTVPSSLYSTVVFT